MKLIMALLFTTWIFTGASAQISTIVIKNKLVIPENPQEEIIRITKSELSKVEFITSKLGEVKGYTISFKFYFKGEKSVYIKKLEENGLAEHIKDHLLGVESGTHFYLEEVHIQMPKKTELLDKKYEFILTD